MMRRWDRDHALTPTVAIGLVIVLLAIYPTPLLPLAWAWQALCERYPVLTLITFRAPPAPIALLLGLAGIGLLAGCGAGLAALLRTHRFNQRLRRSATPMPPRLGRLASRLGIADRITYLAWSQPAACCYGLGRPRIAVTSALVMQLDDEELVAALAHERQHLRRRDPLRYLVLHALGAATFMVPVATSLRRRREARVELAADRAALAVAPRGALAGALLVSLNAPPMPVPAVVGLTATEARIVHLGGHEVMPAIPARLVIATLGLALVITVATAKLAASVDPLERICRHCATATLF